MPTRSVFVATTFSPDGNNRLNVLGQQVVNALPQGAAKITPLGNWHFTWHCYGPKTDEEITKIIEQLKMMEVKHPRTLKVAHLISLPTSHNARVIAWQIHQPKKMINPFDSDWNPHITIARISEPIQKQLGNLPTHLKLPKLKPETFGLYTSTQDANGVRHYEPLWTRPTH